MKLTKKNVIPFLIIFFVLMTIITIRAGESILLGLFIGACVLGGELLLLWMLDVFIVKNNGIFLRCIDDESYRDDGWDSPFIN